MLAKKRSLQLDGLEIARTPLLVPSFSSKGFPQVAKIIETTEEVIESAVLISAYDLYYHHITPPFDFASLIFLDTGGYEASKDLDLSDLGDRDYAPRQWSQEMHESALATWDSRIPTVIISYDHPKERLPIKTQIQRAKRIASSRTSVLREILIKPETKGQTLVKVESIASNIHALADFDIIGLTEKEIGNSLLSRMENIARVRLALDKAGLDKPIHVFGSLDTISTPMYFLAGADIFDGLTWLRFAYREGYTIYKHNYGAVELGVREKAHLIDARCWFHNYGYLKDLELDMRRFLKQHDFRELKYHSEMFREAYESIAEAVGA
jgi:hypothetical protein